MSGEKTEQPTPKRLRDARKKGQVAKSKEVSSATNVIGVFLFLWLFREHYLSGFQNMIATAGERAMEPFDKALSLLLHDLTSISLKLLLPLFLVVIVCDVASNFFQIGFLMAFESIKPDLQKLNPASALKRIFSKKNLMEFVKSLVKVTCLAVTVTLVLRMVLPSLVSAPYGDPSFILDILRSVLKTFMTYISLAFVVLAAADYFFQKRQHLKELMMTKEEVKQEYKEMEGDPHIKSKRRQLHQELLTNTMLQSVKKATVVVTNPTHRAVALFYEKDTTKLPVIVAKGENLLAKRILEIAREEGIPIMTDVPLAHALYEKGQLDDYIPSDLIEPVAEVLKWVYQLKASGAS
ncbi:EscU/YscU/HrcU family type III secretion system export apparatus switch protein [Thermodesulfomicrobium sp. WS]|uniref:type III secretion system export apparatus subunit SctU n=1 Tax=Thermodesulfomicrobium sp. WS TaxID=3004129 RepID=UPI002492ABCE|nr:type III secretion system export apparatus subunit SctU [Thermodesulfomicrobium sp. WS]BDV01969.1 EscU/YscU/HrcU family type III secretion system export apparatus switch protein [Thermodesulfomicrobium sp. WS]